MILSDMGWETGAGEKKLELRLLRWGREHKDSWMNAQGSDIEISIVIFVICDFDAVNVDTSFGQSNA